MNAVTVPTCPACRSSALEHITGDRWRCQACRWLCRINRKGEAVNYLDFATAGRSKRSLRAAARKSDAIGSP